MADATMTGSMFFVAGIFIDVLGVEENESNLSSDRTDKVLLSIVCTDNFGLLILYLEAAEKTQKSSQSCGCSATEQSKLRSQISLPFLSRNSSYQIAEQIHPPPLFFLDFSAPALSIVGGSFPPQDCDSDSWCFSIPPWKNESQLSSGIPNCPKDR